MFVEHLPAIKDLTTQIKSMKRDAEDGQIRCGVPSPDDISLVNSFYRHSPQTDHSSTIEVVEPMLADDFPSLSEEFELFLDAHHRIIYIALGDYNYLSAFALHGIMEGLLLALEEEHIDGIIWATHSIASTEFFDVYDRLLENKDAHWRFCNTAPQRAVLAHPATRMFLSQYET